MIMMPKRLSNGYWIENMEKPTLNRATNPIYWQCQCETNNIHLRATMSSCDECLTMARVAPDAPAEAVNALEDPGEDPLTYR